MQNHARLMETLLQDVRFGFRQLMKQPGFAALAITSMALGIGANTSIFSLVDTALLRPLAVKEPSQLVELYGTLHNGADWSLQSYPNYKDYRDRNTVLSGLCVYRVVVSSLTVNNASNRVWGYLVSGNYFDVLGVKPALGRAFLPEEDQTPDSHPVAVISHNCWQRRFGGDPAIIGKTVQFNSRPFTVIAAVGALVLLLACVNLASLLLTRATERRKEIALRLAIGASRARLVRQLLTESILISLSGGAAGVILAALINNAVRNIRLPS